MRVAVVAVADIGNNGPGNFGLNAATALIWSKKTVVVRCPRIIPVRMKFSGCVALSLVQESMKQPDTNQLILKVCQIVSSYLSALKVSCGLSRVSFREVWRLGGRNFKSDQLYGSETKCDVSMSPVDALIRLVGPGTGAFPCVMHFLLNS